MSIPTEQTVPVACGKGWIGFNAAIITCFLEIRNKTFILHRECLEDTPPLLGSWSLEVERGLPFCFYTSCIVLLFQWACTAIQKSRKSMWDVGLRVRCACESSHCHRGMCQQFCEIRTKSERLDVEVTVSRRQNSLGLPNCRPSGLAA